MKHKHHIIPKHMGGTDEPSNLVELTVEEHAAAHRVLFEQYGCWQDNVAWKISQEKYKTDPQRQKAHSERMKLWWDEKRKVGT